MLEKLSCAALPSQRLSRAAAGVGAMHFVGTGWDFLGFPVKAAASSIGAKFTILPAVHPLSWGDDAIDIRLYRKADRVFCLSDYEKCHLAKRGVPEEKLIRCGLPPMCRNDGDGRRFRIGIEIAERPAVLFIGRRDKGKGYPALLDAWTLVVKQVPDAVLVLAGPGDSDPVRLAAIPSDSVRDLGIADELEKANALAATDVFCLPSAHESFGIVYLEAWFYGKPVICGTAPASRELVREGETGLWSDGSPASIAAGIVALLGNGALRNRLGEAGRTLQQSEYTRDSALATHVASFGMADNEPCAFRV